MKIRPDFNEKSKSPNQRMIYCKYSFLLSHTPTEPPSEPCIISHSRTDGFLSFAHRRKRSFATGFTARSPRFYLLL